MKKLKDLFKSKNMKNGGYSILISVVVIAIMIFLNYIVSALPTTVTKFDMTSADMFTLTEQTENLVKGLEKEVNVYLVANTGEEDSYITEILDRYKSLSSNVKVEYVDPALHPQFASSYTDTELNPNSVIVVSGEKSKVIDYYDIYVSDYSNYYSTGEVTTEFSAESALTSAISYVTSETLPVMYCLEGHGEATFSTTLSGKIEDENIDVQTLSLLTKGEVPEDCDLLFIYGPTSDISSEEEDMIKAYIEKGGKLIVISDWTEEDLPHLYEIADYYGIECSNSVVFEGDGNYYYQYPYYLIPEVDSTDITSPTVANKRYILQPVAHAMTIKDNARSSLSIEPLLETTSSSYAIYDPASRSSLEKESGDVSGPFYTGIAASETISDDIETKCVWFSSTQMLDEQVDSMVSGANTELLLNSISWITGNEESISIRSVSLSSDPLVVSDASKNLWMIVLCIIIPVGTVAAGLVIWTRRRKRK